MSPRSAITCRSWRTSSSPPTPAARPPRASSSSTTRRRSRQHRRRATSAPRSGDDLHIIYTGGTTGHAQGRDVAAGGHLLRPVRRDRRLLEREARRPVGAEPEGRPREAAAAINFTLAPMMHGAGEVTVIRSVIHGDTVVLTPKFDAEQTWRVIEAEKVNVLGITGDAMARPLADKLEEMHDEVDLSSLFSIGSSAAIFSQSIKDQLMERLPNIVVVDSVGATETGMNGIKIAVKGEQQRGGPATVQPSLDSIVVDEDYNLLEPGSGEIGRLARTGNIPLGYYNDPERSARGLLRARRQAVLDPRRLRDGRGGRSGDTARSRLDHDQHRRREGLSRGGRGRAQGPPRRVRRARGRCSRRAVGRARHRGRAGPRGQGAVGRGPRRALPDRSSRRTRRPSRCSSSTRSIGRRAASPTTRGPRSTRRTPRRRADAT